MSWDDELTGSAAEFADTFGESVLFTPKNGTPRIINAVVDRRPMQRINASGQDVTPTMTIEVQNDPIKGISSAELDAYGNDKITVDHRPGTPKLAYGVHIPDASFGPWIDAGMITLDLK